MELSTKDYISFTISIIGFIVLILWLFITSDLNRKNERFKKQIEIKTPIYKEFLDKTSPSSEIFKNKDTEGLINVLINFKEFLYLFWTQEEIDLCDDLLKDFNKSFNEWGKLWNKVSNNLIEFRLLILNNFRKSIDLDSVLIKSIDLDSVLIK